MKLQPTNVEFCYHKDDLQLVGWFDHYYEPADNENERLGLGAEGEELEIRDGKYYYENRQDFLFGVESEPYYGF